MARDEFPESVKRTAALRVGYMCSICRKPTAGPHSDPQKFLVTGEAAHINGAAPGSARYDPNQTEGERNGIANAIWVCATCHREIDRDVGKFAPAKLKTLKFETEDFMERGGVIPALPEIQLSNSHGVPLPDDGAAILTGAECERYRQHSLTLNNASSLEILNLDAVFQLHEIIDDASRIGSPAGVIVRFDLPPSPLTAFCTGAASVTIGPGHRRSNRRFLKIDKIPAKRSISIHFRSRLPRSIEPYATQLAEMELPRTSYWPDYLCGTFQFRFHEGFLDRRFVCQIDWDGRLRKGTCKQCVDYDDSIQLAEHDISDRG